MSLSSDLISQFVKSTKDTTETKAETTVYGKTVEYDGRMFVQIDGSDLLTPISTTVDVKAEERVTVMIKDHTATITGNITSPAARTDDVKEIGNKITEFEILIGDKVTTQQLEAEIARINTLVSDNVTIKEKLTANEAAIGTLQATDVTITGKLEANEASIKKIEADKLDVKIAEATFATIGSLDATNANIYNLQSTYGKFEELTTKNFEAVNADIENLETTKLNAEQAEVIFANIDFSNIGEAAIEKLFADSGIIKDLIMSDGSVTGELVGVTIKGDLIEANTLKADKLVVKGEDGLYYKLNIDGGALTSDDVTVEDLQNGLSGSIIVAKSITAEKIAVDDLVAFNATIGGFHITTNSLYSGVKSSITNTTSGVYMDKEGQFAVGDSNNYIKYFKDADGKWKIDISAAAIKMGGSNKTVEEFVKDEINNIEVGGRNLLLNSNTFAGENVSVNSDAIIEDTYRDLNVYSHDNSAATSGHVDILQFKQIYPQKLSDVYTLSFYAKGTGTLGTFFYGPTGYLECGKVEQSTGVVRASGDGNSQWDLTDTWTRYWVTWTLKDEGDITIEKYVLFRLFYGSIANICGIKLEKGSVATDWTPAPEDVDESIDEAQNAANEANSSAANNAERITSASTEIDSIKGMISSLVTDENGTSLMTQNGDGWSFNMGAVNKALSDASQSLTNLQNKDTQTDAVINNLNSLINDMYNRTAYIDMKEDSNGNPYLELGRRNDESGFKVRITNSTIDFSLGSLTPIRLENRSGVGYVVADKLIVDDELIQGGFAWVIHGGGNLGLVWKG